MNQSNPARIMNQSNQSDDTPTASPSSSEHLDVEYAGQQTTGSVNSEDDFVSAASESGIIEAQDNDKNKIAKCGQFLKRMLFTNAISDHLTHIGRVQVIESIEAVRVLKFIIVNTVMIVIVHSIVRKAGWEHDQYYSLRDFFHYDFGAMVLDSTFFAIVGRLWQRDGVDRLIFILPTFASSILISASTNIWFLRNSITLYNISCTWP